MNVKLIAVTNPEFRLGEFELRKDSLTAEELIVYMARVSNPENQDNMATAPKLIKYLLDHHHWSPFDMVNMVVEVKTSKAIAIQILRHWSIKPQEFSQRYGEVAEIEPIELRKKAGSNRQGSDGESFDPEMCVDSDSDGSIMYYNPDETPCHASDRVRNYINEGVHLYKELLYKGVAKECARMILPMATSTTMYLNGSVRSWIHYMQQRLSEHAQKEHREVALKIEQIFKEQFPNITEALGL